MVIVWARDRWDWSRNYRDLPVVYWQWSSYRRQGFLPGRPWFVKVRSADVLIIVVILELFSGRMVSFLTRKPGW